MNNWSFWCLTIALAAALVGVIVQDRKIYHYRKDIEFLLAQIGGLEAAEGLFQECKYNNALSIKAQELQHTFDMLFKERVARGLVIDRFSDYPSHQ